MKISFIPLLLLALLPLVLASDEEPKPTKPSWWSWLNPFGDSDEYPLPIEEWKPDYPVPDESWIKDKREKDQTPPSSTANDPLPTSFPVTKEWKPDWPVALPVALPNKSLNKDKRDKDQTPPSSTAEDPLPTTFPVPEDLPAAKAETAEDPVPTTFSVPEDLPVAKAEPDRSLNEDKREKDQTPPISAAEDPLPTSSPFPEPTKPSWWSWLNPFGDSDEYPLPIEEWKPDYPVPDDSWIENNRKKDQTPPSSTAEDPLPTTFSVPEDLPVAKAEDPVPTSLPVTEPTKPSWWSWLNPFGDSDEYPLPIEEWKPDYPVPDDSWIENKRDHKSPAPSDNTPEDRTSGDVPTAASASNEKSGRVLPQNDDQPDKPTIGGRIKGFFSNLWKPKNAATEVNSHQIKDHDDDVPVPSDERLTKDAKTDKPTIANRVKGIFSKISNNFWKPSPTPTISDDENPAETDKPSKPNGVLSKIWNTTKAAASHGVNSVKGMFSKKEMEEENSDHTSDPTHTLPVPPPVHTYPDVQPPVTKSPSRRMNTWAQKIMRLPVFERFRLFKSGPSRIPKETSEEAPGVFQKVGRFCKGVVCSIADIHKNLNANHFG